MSPTFSEKRAFVKQHKPRPGKPTPSFAWIWASMFAKRAPVHDRALK